MIPSGGIREKKFNDSVANGLLGCRYFEPNSSPHMNPSEFQIVRGTQKISVELADWWPHLEKPTLTQFVSFLTWLTGMLEHQSGCPTYFADEPNPFGMPTIVIVDDGGNSVFADGV